MFGVASGEKTGFTLKMPNTSFADIAGLSFLIVDDEEFTLAAMKKTLESMGATKIATAADGLRALSHLVDAGAPDVMLLDLKMPEMSGTEMLRQLAEHKYTGAVIFVSGADRDTIAVAEGLANYRDLNILGHIVKPMTPDKLGGFLDKLE